MKKFLAWFVAGWCVGLFAGWCVVAFYADVCCAPVGGIWRAEGISMLPVIHPGDVLITEPLPFASLHPGQIVIYQPQGHWTRARFVTHRIRRGFGGKWVMRGDNNPVDDPGYLTAENYKATVWKILHK